MISIAIALLAAPRAEQPPLKLSLVCQGVGDREVQHLGVGAAFAGRHAVTGLSTSTSQDEFAEQADVEIDGDASRLRPPRRLFTWLYHPTGWLKISDIVVTDDTIDGRVQFSWALHPRLHIDRRTGSISFDAQNGAYSGQCEVPDPAKRAF